MSTAIQTNFTRTKNAPTGIVLIEPGQLNCWYEYTVLDAVSHHDPGQGDKSNFSMFRREMQTLQRESTGRLITQSEIDSICAAFPVPVEVAGYWEGEPLSRYIGSILAMLFIKEYGGGEGVGIFSGMERYTRLIDRFKHSAASSFSLKEFWSIASRELKVPALPVNLTKIIMPVLSVPSTLSIEVLKQIAEYPDLVVMLGQTWAEAAKLENYEYAEKSGRDQSSGEYQVLNYVVSSEAPAAEISAPVPVHSGNDIRHHLRWSASLHLLNKIGLTWKDELPTGVKALLENASSMAGTQPANVFVLKDRIRRTFPHWSLLGGSTDTFLLGEGRLEAVHPYIVCQENNANLAAIDVQSSRSVFDMLDRITLTSHANHSDQSPMPYSFEVLQKGVKMMVHFQFAPFTTDLEFGAFFAAMETFINANGHIGGQGARGFGKVEVKPFQLVDREAGRKVLYEQYLADNAAALRDELLSGRLGSGVVVCK